MGICGFKYFEETQTLECYPFNFYILPYTFDSNMQMDKNFTVSLSSFNFLAQNKFDFNKLFYESVGYLSHHDYDSYKSLRAMKQKQSDSIEVAHFDTPDAVIYCNSQYLTIKAWLDSTGYKITDIDHDERNQLKVDVSYTRAKLFQSLVRNLPKMFPSVLLDAELVQEELSNEMYLIIRKSSQELRLKRIADRDREEKYTELQRFIHAKNLNNTSASKDNGMLISELKKLITEDPEWSSKNDKYMGLINKIEDVFGDPSRVQQAFDKNTEDEVLHLLARKVVEVQPSPHEDALGFTRIVDFMSKLNKPIISHNGILDLMFLYDKFYRPLPETQMEFRTAINSLFPHIYDCKHMINTRLELQSLFPNSMLSEVYKRVTLRPDFGFGQNIEIHSGFPDYSLSGDIYHEAGFDALMTGVSWFKMMTLLGKKRKFPGVEYIEKDENIQLMDKNRIPMASIKQSMNLNPIGPDQSGDGAGGKTFLFVL